MEKPSAALGNALAKPVIRTFIAMAHKRSYPPRHSVIHAGDAPETLFLILEGSVTVYVDDPDGREMILAYLGPGDFFGEICSFPDQRIRTAIVRTRTSTLTAEVSLQAFRDFNRSHPDIMFEVAGQMAARLRDTSRRLRDLTFVDVAGRIAGALLQLGNSPAAKINSMGVVVRMSRVELASIVGCSREVAGRVLIKMEEDGLISSQGRNIQIFRGSGLAGTGKGSAVRRGHRVTCSGAGAMASRKS